MDSLQSNESMVVVARWSLAITLYYGKNVIWNDFKSNHEISNQIQIKSHVFQIKSLCVIQSWFKSNHDLDLLITGMCMVSSDCGRGLGPSQTTPSLYRCAQLTCRCPLRYAPLPPAWVVQTIRWRCCLWRSSASAAVLWDHAHMLRSTAAGH